VIKKLKAAAVKFVTKEGICMYALAKKDLFREKIRKRVKKVRTTCLVHAKVYTIHT
jgi:hypothetical protein